MTVVTRQRLCYCSSSLLALRMVFCPLSSTVRPPRQRRSPTAKAPTGMQIRVELGLSAAPSRLPPIERSALLRCCCMLLLGCFSHTPPSSPKRLCMARRERRRTSQTRTIDALGGTLTELHGVRGDVSCD